MSETLGSFLTFKSPTEDLKEREVVYLVHIYDKGQLDNLTKDQIIELLKKAGLI